MRKNIAPYGSWASPFTSDMIASDSVRLGGVIVDGEDVYWLESRPSEGGRSALVKATRNAPPYGSIDVTPQGFNVRNRVHEYGGAAAAVHDGAVYFSNDADGRLYRQALGDRPTALTQPDTLRFADAAIDAPRERGIWVMEDHRDSSREAVNSLVSVPLAGGAPEVMTSGHDFYSAPRLSPDGSRLAWLSWNHPSMPWDGCELWLAKLSEDGAPQDARIVAGGKSEAIFQPAWSPDGNLYFISDRTGWWNIYRLDGTGSSPVAPMDAEFGLPYWAFGMSTYAFESPESLICQYADSDGWHAAAIDLSSGSLRAIDTGYSFLGSMHASGGVITAVGHSPDRPDEVIQIDIETGEKLRTIARSIDIDIDAARVSVAQPLEFPTEDGLTARAYFYPPASPEWEGPPDERPPLLVMSHGGPTGAADTDFDLRIQFWTSRGFAVVDVNYGGSTGYGRRYRERLNGRWGIVDVDDCCNAAKYLVERGLVDTERLAITGGSAGGYTTLAALAFRDVFKAGVSLYGIGDLEAMARDTHKFESRYLDGLIGPYQDRRDLYAERSPIHHIDGLACPIAFFQGLEDKIVPPNQARMMADALRVKGLPVAHIEYEGEQHGFRRAENIRHALEGALYFYSKIFGFEPADDIEPILIENL